MTLLETCKRIADNWQAEKYDGLLIDANSASLYVQVHEKLNAKNREKLESLTPEQALKLCWRVAAGK
jgi:hypothetical protein